MPDFVVTPEEAGLTIEAWLQKRIPAAPAGYLNQLLKKGKVSNRSWQADPRRAGQRG